jgi:hypothetical protein
LIIIFKQELSKYLSFIKILNKAKQDVSVQVEDKQGSSAQFSKANFKKKPKSKND